MSRHQGLKWSCWPSEGDCLMLTTALHVDDDVSLAAWRRLRPTIDLEDLNGEQYRMLPLLGERLARLAPDDPKIGMMRGLRRRAMIEGGRNLAALDQVIEMLERASIDVVVLKGAALCLGVYPAQGLRPFYDLDLLVAPERHAEALELFRAAGWHPKKRAFDFEGNHAIDLVGGQVPVDLHRASNPEIRHLGVDRLGGSPLEAVPAKSPLPSGRHPLVLAPTDNLLHTIVHGTQGYFGAVPVLNWIADAAVLLDGGEVDLGRLIALAEIGSVSPLLRDALRLISEVTGVPADRRSQQMLGAVRVSQIARLRTAAFRDQLAKVPPLSRLGLRASEAIGRRMTFHLNQTVSLSDADAARWLLRRAIDRPARRRAGGGSRFTA